MTTVKAANKIPLSIYGTAWKQNRTRDLVKQAILAGFRGIDTAAQPKHYQEDLVGEGIRDAITEGLVTRQDLYIQTKFTSIHAQDRHRMPFDPAMSITQQVGTSVASSLRNLRHTQSDSGESYIDCLILHSPFPSLAETQEAWRAMELHIPHSVRTLGISNIYHLEALQALYDFASVKPSVVQNRFYATTGYDRAIRAFCEEKGIRYQSFWTLTANPRLLKSMPVGVVAQKVGVNHVVALYSLILGLGNVSVLNGSTNVDHMVEDLKGVDRVRRWSQSSSDVWRAAQSAFDEELHGKQS